MISLPHVAHLVKEINIINATIEPFRDDITDFKTLDKKPPRTIIALHHAQNDESLCDLYHTLRHNTSLPVASMYGTPDGQYSIMKLFMKQWVKLHSLFCVTLFYHPIEQSFRMFLASLYDREKSLQQNLQHYKTIRHRLIKQATAWIASTYLSGFGINPYAHPFPKERGWALYHYGQHRFLFLSAYIPHKKRDSIIQKALSIKTWETPPKDKATDALMPCTQETKEAHQACYDAMQEHQHFAPHVINAIKESPMCQHFYTAEHITSLLTPYLYDVASAHRFDPSHKKTSTKGDPFIIPAQAKKGDTKQHIDVAFSTYDLTIVKHGMERALRSHVINLVCVYQMGKVGSTSIHQALKHSYQGCSLHFHHLNDHQRCTPKNHFVLAWAERGYPMSFIIPVRNPLERCISWFFDGLHEYAPEWEAELKKRQAEGDTRDFLKTIPLKEWEKRFFSVYPNIETSAATWFDRNLKHYFDFDAFALDFPRDKGYLVHRRHNLQFLILQSELPNVAKEHIIKNFLGLADLHLNTLNKTDDKPHSAIYTQFKQNVTFSKEQMDHICSRQLFTHFYTQETIDATRQHYMAASPTAHTPSLTLTEKSSL
ncbi:MAG: hypothetical protein GDA54_00780 [Alphaproteobacteria bacterium GM7ARS4]|nr:hypothetical protein [Alphaproteobacteria bacterium GM7ARS4]